MEIIGPPLNLLTPRQIQATVKAWQVGQVFQALVIKQASPKIAILQVNNQPLRAETNVSLTPGQRLELTVIKTGEKPLLQARFSEANQNQYSNKTVDHAINSLLKQSLPKQASLSSLLANLALLNQQSSNSVIPRSTLDLVKQLIQQLPDKNHLTQPGQLKQSIHNSGIFLENKIKNLAAENNTTKSNPAKKQALKIKPPITGTKSEAITKNITYETKGDVKLNLLRLFSNIQEAIRSTSQQSKAPLNQSAMASQTSYSTPLPSNPLAAPTIRGQGPQPQTRNNPSLPGISNLQLQLLELGRQVESALARTQLHQAASLPTNEQPSISQSFELLVRNNEHVDIFDFVISEEEDQTQGKEKNEKGIWTITLAFNLPNLGPVYTKLRMVDDIIDTTFWAESAKTTTLFNQHLNELRQRYQQSGIEASELACFQGKPIDSFSKLPHIVLDINA